MTYFSPQKLRKLTAPKRRAAQKGISSSPAEIARYFNRSLIFTRNHELFMNNSFLWNKINGASLKSETPTYGCSQPAMYIHSLGM